MKYISIQKATLFTKTLYEASTARGGQPSKLSVLSYAWERMLGGCRIHVGWSAKRNSNILMGIRRLKVAGFLEKFLETNFLCNKREGAILP